QLHLHSFPTRRASDLIPAYAGETIRRSRRCTQPRVDPRVCGGNAAAPINSPPPKGRSPRMRGKPHLLARAAAATRSIPAYAGERSEEHTSELQSRENL